MPLIYDEEPPEYGFCVICGRPCDFGDDVCEMCEYDYEDERAWEDYRDGNR